MIHELCAEYENIKLIPLRKDDIEYLRAYRNNKELSTFLRPIGEITKEMQEKWYEEYLQDNTIMYWAICEKNLQETVGALAIYGMNGHECEIGKIVVGNPQLKGKGTAFKAMIMAMKLGNHYLGIEDFKLDCHEENIAAMKTYQKIGFQEFGKHPFISGGIELEMNVAYKKVEEKMEWVSQIKISDISS